MAAPCGCNYKSVERGRGEVPNTNIHGRKTTDHIIYACERLTKERDRLKKKAIRTNKWPINKRDLIRRHYNEFTNLINEIQFDKLNVE